MAGQQIWAPTTPSTLTTRNQVAAMMAARGDHSGAEAEFRDVLAARLRVLGPGHPSTRVTARWIDHLERRKKD